MLNTLKLAKNSIGQINKFKKYKILAFAFALKLLLSAIGIIFISYLAMNASEAGAAYGVDTSIKQVKTANSSAIYYLDHARGLKKTYVSAKAFLSYGNQWSDVKVISEAELNKWPEVRLVKSNSNSSVYYISNGQKALITSEKQFNDSGFKWSDIVTISQTDLDEYETIDFKAAGAIDYSNSQLSITLDSLNPKSGYLVTNTQDNLVAVFNLKAISQPVEIKTLVLDLKGVLNTDVIKEIYLTDESDIQYSTFAYPNNRQAVFNFNNQPIIISAGGVKRIKVYVNLNDTSINVANHTLQISIDQASNITGAKAVGVFPLTGEIFKFISGNNNLEKVVASEQTLNIKDNKAVIGTTEKNIGRFNFLETSGKANVFVKELKFANMGTVGASSINNFKLKNRSGEIISTTAIINSDRELIFKLNNYKIKKGDGETFSVIADILDGDNSTINLDLISAKVGSSQGDFNLFVSITNLNEIITIKRESVNIVSKDLKANNKVFSEQTGAIIGNFEIRNNNQKITLSRLTFNLEKNSSMPGLTETVYLVNYNTGETLGYFDGERFDSGSVYVDLSGLELKAKQNLTVALVTEISDKAPNGGYYKVVLKEFVYRSGLSPFYSNQVNVSGAKLTVSQSNVYLYPNNDLGDQAFTKGQKNIKIASFIIEGAAGGNTKITGINFTTGSDSSGVISYDNGFSNLKFYIGSTKIKTIKTPYGNDLEIVGFNYTLKSGTRSEIKVYADTETDVKASEVQLAISDIKAVNSASLIPAAVKNLNVNSHKTTFGLVGAEITKITDGFVVKGEDDNVIAAFKVKNSGFEDLKLQSITINAVDQELTYSLGYSNLKVVNRDTQKKTGSTLSKPVAGANKLSLGNYTLKVGEEAVFDIHVKTSDDVTDKNVSIYFSDFTAQGKKSKVSALISGDPTDSYTFTIATGTSSDKDENDKSASSTVKLIKPVSGKITYDFNDSSYPYKDTLGQHTGIDIAVDQGTKVKAAAAGTVIEVVDGGLTSQASYVAIMHLNGLVTRYAHLSRIDVKVGDAVKQGDTIGLSGGTPGTSGAGSYSNGAHLHFEVLLNGSYVDPEKYL
ncbi:MAG: M23 family metallopeptidase [Patescibacteria group bacterium]|jgi:murein DD-endopeptidase MepM/ murein hydrolase activator NlpD